MTTVTVDEAKASFGDLLRRAQAGERVLITVANRPPVELSVTSEGRRSAAVVFGEIAELRKSNRLEGLSVRELRDEGRR